MPDPTRTRTTERVAARTLKAIAEHARYAQALRRSDLDFGDRLVVRTRNSLYSIWALGGDRYAVSGGWFDRKSDSPTTVAINGCTYGASAIRHDVVAARGLFLEFGNNVLTTRIMDWRVIRNEEPPGLN